MVSVVIPTFRREQGVVAAVRSVLAQGDVVHEVIVVDDSAENSAASHVAAIGDPRVRYVPCETPTGGRPAVVRNRGLRLATGTYLYFLDDDDEMEPGALDVLTAALERVAGVGVAIGVVQPVGTDDRALAHERAFFAHARARLLRTPHRFSFVARSLFSQALLVCSACMVRRPVAVAIGGFAEDVRRAQDGDFYLRAVRESGFVFVDRPVVRYQTGAPSLIRSADAGDLLRQSYQTIYRHYRRRRGVVEFIGLRLLAGWHELTDRR